MVVLSERLLTAARRAGLFGAVSVFQLIVFSSFDVVVAQNAAGQAGQQAQTAQQIQTQAPQQSQGQGGQQTQSSPAQGQSEASNFCQQLLSAHPNGGAALAAEVSALVVAAPDAASEIHGCACPANPVNAAANNAQAQAIGQGLSQAVLRINQSNPDAAQSISTTVAQSCSPNLKTAFLQGTGDQTAANRGGGGGQPGGGQPGGGQPGGGPPPGGGGGGGQPGGGPPPGPPPGPIGSGGGGGTGGGPVSPN